MLDYRKIEEASLHAWPALRSHQDEGWLLRYANGYTKRSNSVSPIYAAPVNLEKRIYECEKFYQELGQKCIFKITPYVCPEHLDFALEQKGYRQIDRTSVQIVSLANLLGPIEPSVTFAEELSETWFTNYVRLNHISEDHQGTLRGILNQIAPNKRFVSLDANGETVACGLGVVEDGLIGLFDIIVDECQRRRGYGQRLVRNILKIGRDMGAKDGYLQVMLDNWAAFNLYTMVGFQEAYQYWYRIQEN